ncbi:homeobox protein 6-like [Lingula anatina]|uniref:Homeobox protein 6-like n=1 Tax=Lingula anatina TaxID=7574 RepID=A0A1S3JSJ3_LINAN|nr:homeobox protein 6-like [Lingula anatina]|eukprot:XP_013413086.1 homeobox protein 6-like [Lingula anatina]
MQGESLFKVIFLVLLVSCARVSGWSCYDCYGSTCENIKINPAVAGKCQTGFRCFTRLKEDRVTVHNKGCYSHSGSLYGVNLDYDGCRPQKIDSRDQVLCLCRGEGCNADTKKAIKTTTQPTSPSPTTTTSTTTSSTTTSPTTTTSTTTSTKSPPITSKPAISTTVDGKIRDGFFTVAELGIRTFNGKPDVECVLENRYPKTQQFNAVYGISPSNCKAACSVHQDCVAAAYHDDERGQALSTQCLFYNAKFFTPHTEIQFLIQWKLFTSNGNCFRASCRNSIQINNHILPSVPTKSLVGITIESCKAECYGNPKCLAVSYEHVTSSCEVFGTMKNTAAKAPPSGRGWTSYVKSCVAENDNYPTDNNNPTDNNSNPSDNNNPTDNNNNPSDNNNPTDNNNNPTDDNNYPTDNNGKYYNDNYNQH